MAVELTAYIRERTGLGARNRAQTDLAVNELTQMAVVKPSIFFDARQQLLAHQAIESLTPGQSDLTVVASTLKRLNPKEIKQRTEKLRGVLPADEFIVLIRHLDGIDGEKTEEGNLALALLDGYFSEPVDVIRKKQTREGFEEAARLTLRHTRAFAEALLQVEKNGDPDIRRKMERALLEWAVVHAVSETAQPTIGDILEHASFTPVIGQALAREAGATQTIIESLCRRHLDDHILEGRLSLTSIAQAGLNTIVPRDLSYRSPLDVHVNTMERECLQVFFHSDNVKDAGVFVFHPLETPYEQLALESRIREIVDWSDDRTVHVRGEAKRAGAIYLHFPGDWKGFVVYEQSMANQARELVHENLANHLKTVHKGRPATLLEAETVFSYLLPSLFDIEKGSHTTDSFLFQSLAGQTAITERGKVVRFGRKKERELKQAGVHSMVVRNIPKTMYATTVLSHPEVHAPLPEQINQAGPYITVAEFNLWNNAVVLAFSADGTCYYPPVLDPAISSAVAPWLRRIALGYIAAIKNPEESDIQIVPEGEGKQQAVASEKKHHAFYGRDPVLRVLPQGHKPSITEETEKGVMRYFSQLGHARLNTLFIQIQNNPVLLETLKDETKGDGYGIQLYTFMRRLLLRISQKHPVPIFRSGPHQQINEPVYQLSFVDKIEKDAAEYPPVPVSCPSAAEKILS